MLAKNIATEAFNKSILDVYDSPFVVEARKCGNPKVEEKYKDRTGGKSDDITVVIGKINIIEYKWFYLI